MKLNYALSLAIFLALMGTASATWPTAFNLNHVINFHNAMNFTAIDSNDALFYGTDIGKVNYVYITANNLAGTFLLQGYNGTTFIGNVSGYQFRTGIIVPLKTISGKSYNTLALFWNQSIGMATQSMEDYNRNVTIDINAVKYPLFEYLTGINITHPPLLYSVKDNVAFLGCTYLNNQTCSWQFRPKQPYFFIQTSAYPNQNISVDYIDTDGWGEAILSANSVTASILSKNWGGPPALTHSVTLPLNIVINASSAVLATNGIGWNGASYLYNAGGSQSIGLPTWIGTSNLATIKIYTDNAPNENTAFYLLPAYTTQYTNSTVFYNATPKLPINTPSICFQYRIHIDNVTWTTNFTTLAYPGHLGTSFNLTEPAQYLSLTLPRLGADMGDGCKGIYLYDTNRNQTLQYGQIPYTRLSCNSTAVKLIVANRTLTGAAFSSFYLYYGQISPIYNDFSNTTVKGRWEIATGNYTPNIPFNALPYMINLGSPLYANPNSIISMYSSTQLSVHYSGSYFDQLSSAGSGSVTDYTGNPNKQILMYDEHCGLPSLCTNLAAQTLTGTWFSGMSNTTHSDLSGWNMLGNATVSLFGGNRANITRLNSSITIGSVSVPTHNSEPVEYAPQNSPINCAISSNNSGNNTNSNRTVIIPKGSGTLIPSNLSNSSVFGNLGRYSNATKGTVLFYDMTVPVVFLVILALLEIVLIALAFTSHDEWVTIFGLVGANLFGLFIALGGGKLDANAIFLLISLICAGYYVIKNIDKVWKHG